MLEYIQYNSLNLFKGVLYCFQYLKLNPKDVKNVKKKHLLQVLKVKQAKSVNRLKFDKYPNLAILP